MNNMLVELKNYTRISNRIMLKLSTLGFVMGYTILPFEKYNALFDGTSV